MIGKFNQTVTFVTEFLDILGIEKRRRYSHMSTQEQARILMQSRYQSVKLRQQSILKRTGQELGINEEITSYWNPIHF
jgi:hypothetical protein